MKYFPQTISAAKEIEEERKQEESAKLKVDFNDDDDQLDESIRANHYFFCSGDGRGVWRGSPGKASHSPLGLA